MAIKFPPDNYSRSQILVTNLPVDKSYVVCGAAGTGKTMLALYRANEIRKKYLEELEREPELLFVVYNRPLQNYLKDELRRVGLNRSHATTYHSWLYNQIYGKSGLCEKDPPQIRAYKYAWDDVESDLRALRDGGKLVLDHVIIDEAQDLPFALVKILHEVANNVTIFIDDRQQVIEGDNLPGERPDEPLTVEGAVTIVGDAYGKLVLTENHRNSQAIVDVASLFLRKGDIAPEAINKGGRKPELRQYQRVEDCIETIRVHAQNNPDQNIAVFVPGAIERKRYASLLREGGTNARQYVDSDKTPNFNPEEKGFVKLLTYQTFKGLEFDAVFMPELDHNYFRNDTTIRINQIMVGVTRAKERLFLSAANIDDERSIVLREIKAHPNYVDTVEPLGTVELKWTGKTDDFDDEIPF